MADDATARQEARAHYAKGTSAFDLGQYEVAIAEYEAAYKAFNEPTLLYNLGQAHRLARHLTQALHFYRVFLVKVPDASNRAEVEAKIKALEAALELEQKTRHMPPETAKPPPPEPTRPTTPTTPSPPSEPASTRPSPPPPSEKAPEAVPLAAVSARPADPGRGLKIGGGVLAGVGLGIVVGGVVTGVLSKNAADSISNANAKHLPYDPGQYASYKTNLAMTGALLAVGGVAVVTGIVVAVIGVKRSKSDKGSALRWDPLRAGALPAITF